MFVMFGLILLRWHRFGAQTNEMRFNELKSYVDKGDTNLYTPDGKNIFMVTIENCSFREEMADRYLELSKRALAMGIDINEQNEQTGETVVFYAKGIKEMNYLASSGADFNIQNNEGDYLIHKVSKYIPEVRDIIFNRTYDINQVNGKGDTTLHMSCREYNLELIHILLDKGANPFLLNSNGINAMEVYLRNVDSKYRVIKTVNNANDEYDRGKNGPSNKQLKENKLYNFQLDELKRRFMCISQNKEYKRKHKPGLFGR